MSYEDYQRRIIEAQQQWNRDRDTIYRTQGHYNGFDGELQPAHITTPDNYDHLTLEEMQASVAAMKPKLVDDSSRAWSNIGTKLLDSFDTFKREFERTITGQNGKSGWTGAAADAAVTAVKNYHEKSVPLATAATMTALKLSEMKTGLEQTQALMPGLTERPEITGKTLPKDGIMKVDDHNRTEAEQESRRILRTVYGQVAVQTDVGVPYMPTAPTIVDGPAVSGPNPGLSPSHSDGGPSNAGGSSKGSDDTKVPAAEDSGEKNPDQSSTQPDTQPSTGSPDGTSPAGTNSQSTTPTAQSTTPGAGTQTGTTSNSPTTGTPGTSTPGASTPTTGTPGVGSPNRSSSGSGIPSSGRPTGTSNPGTGSPGNTAGPGRSVTGTPATGTTTSTAAAARQSTGTQGRSGMSGMPGAGGGQGKGDEDRKSGVPDYLVTAENGQELTGLDSQPRTVPPVIGGDNDSERY